MNADSCFRCCDDKEHAFKMQSHTKCLDLSIVIKQKKLTKKNQREKERKEERECMELWLNKLSGEPAGPASDTRSSPSFDITVGGRYRRSVNGSSAGEYVTTSSNQIKL
jgi:hypothetical protein